MIEFRGDAKDFIADGEPGRRRGIVLMRTGGQRVVETVAWMSKGLRDATDAEITVRSRALRYRAKSGEPLEKLAPEGFALVREAARRTLDMEHYDVQLVGGWHLFRGRIAEMETGEGKTLAATLPLYLMALPGRGAHLATVNDYLARRDAHWMGPIYEILGLSVGVIQTGMPPEQRRRAYGCDITYGTAKEFGFDFLKDRLLLRSLGKIESADAEPVERFRGLVAAERDAAATESGEILPAKPEGREERPMQRAPFFALVDEADSILIDEARTPLIISAAPGESKERIAATFQWAAAVAGSFQEGAHFQYEHARRQVKLTGGGRQLVRSLEKPPLLDRVGLVDLYEFVERAIKVEREFLREQHYVVHDGEVVIVDEYTGRLAEGRKWSAGIHQAVEAKEGAEATVETGHAARVTVQDFFLRYPFLAGMTGTARSSARELKRIYRLPVKRIPTNRPIRRNPAPTRVFATADAKWRAIAEEAKTLSSQGIPVLIGTRSIDRSERLSRELNAVGVEHQVLNARKEAEEAEIIAQAGQPGRVTVSTNMAGRGTDIQLGAGVAERGGLHVFLTELHESARIDRQLTGRCGRQGDPGVYHRFLAMDDELLKLAWGPAAARRLAKTSLSRGEVILRRAQRKVERKHYHDRRVLLYHERQRRKMLAELGRDPYLDSAD